MRYALAIAVVAITLAAAVYVHQRHVSHTVVVAPAQEYIPPSAAYQKAIDDASAGKLTQKDSNALDTGYAGQAAKPAETSTTLLHPSWEDPAAVLIALGGLAVAVGIIASARRRTSPA
jgi:hypothetical protein